MKKQKKKNLVKRLYIICKYLPKLLGIFDNLSDSRHTKIYRNFLKWLTSINMAIWSLVKQIYLDIAI